MIGCNYININSSSNQNIPNNHTLICDHFSDRIHPPLSEQRFNFVVIPSKIKLFCWDNHLNTGGEKETVEMQGNPGGGGGLDQIPPIGSAILKVLGVFLASRDHTVKSRGVSHVYHWKVVVERYFDSFCGKLRAFLQVKRDGKIIRWEHIWYAHCHCHYSNWSDLNLHL